MTDEPQISGSTRLFCLLGDPASHSKSPAMMNAAFRAERIDAVYVALQVSSGDLEAAVKGLAACDIGGANVTAPHKEAVGVYLDALSPAAQKTRSVNTIVNEKGRLVGHSTDGAGLVGAIRDELGVKIAGGTILVCGAGGAARGVLPALLEQRPRAVTIANRTRTRAASLVREFDAGGTLTAIPLEPGDLSRAAGVADVVINATSIPITEADLFGIDLLSLKAHALVFDMNYNSDARKIRTLLAARGIRHSDGLPMLLHQGACSFSLWTGRTPPLSAMRKALGL